MFDTIIVPVVRLRAGDLDSCPRYEVALAGDRIEQAMEVVP
jgi:hypothetical protein